MNKRTASLTTHIPGLFIALLLLALIFEDPISIYVHNFKYLDETVALVGAIYYLVTWRRGGHAHLGIWIPLALYSLSGFLGFFLYAHQPLVAGIGDWFLNMKFFFAIAFGIALYKSRDQVESCYLVILVKSVTILFVLLIIVYYVLTFFGMVHPSEYRFGIPVVKLFYSHSDYLAAAEFVVVLLTLRLSNQLKHKILWIILEVLVICAALRYKAIAVALMCAAVFFIVIVAKKRFRMWHFGLIIAVVAGIGWNYLLLNYSGHVITARGALTDTSFVIASDHVPLGTGFGSYASYMSNVYYSPVYSEYGLERVWGITRDANSDAGFISDTFWPMVLGQTGYFGLLMYGIVILRLLFLVHKQREISRFIYAASLCSVLFLLIQSTSSAAFVGSYAIPVGLWLGLMYAEGAASSKDTYRGMVGAAQLKESPALTRTRYIEAFVGRMRRRKTK